MVGFFRKLCKDYAQRVEYREFALSSLRCDSWLEET